MQFLAAKVGIRSKTSSLTPMLWVYGFGDHSPLEMGQTLPYPWSGADVLERLVSIQIQPLTSTLMTHAPPLPLKKQYLHGSRPSGTTRQVLQYPGDAAWAWLVNLDHTYFVSTCLDVGESRMEPHGHGWPITSNINTWRWTCQLA